MPQPLRLKKPYAFTAEFDRLTESGRRFKPKEVDRDGYRVVQEPVASVRKICILHLLISGARDAARSHAGDQIRRFSIRQP
jgi:hypothetical protein